MFIPPLAQTLFLAAPYWFGPDGVVTIRSLLRSWKVREQKFLGDAVTMGLEEESLGDRHFLIACGLPFAADGLVLV